MCNSSPVGLPSNTRLFQDQVAGHVHGEGKTKLGILQHEDGSILKPIDPNDPRSARELEFYQTVSSESCTNPHLLKLRKFLPQFLGIWDPGSPSKCAMKYMKIENVTAPFQHPSILDIKIGPQTYDPEAPLQKREMETCKFPAGKTLGFRILGMKVYKNTSQDYMDFKKDFGRSQTEETILSALHMYFNESDGPTVQHIIKTFLSRMKEVRLWFLNQKELSFYSSSLLFMYEPLDLREPSCDVHMIDFAHVFRCQGADENYIFGLERLIECFTNLLKKLKTL